jgi:hypothetical protein
MYFCHVSYIIDNIRAAVEWWVGGLWYAVVACVVSCVKVDSICIVDQEILRPARCC